MEFLVGYRTYWGDFAALGSALTWAIAIIFFQLAGRYLAAIPLNLFKNAVGCLLIALTLMLTGETFLPQLTGKEWGLIVLSSFLGITIADVLMLESLRRLGAGMQAVVECAYSPSIILVAFVLFGEMLPMKDLLGGALVLVAVWVGSKDPHITADRKTINSGIVLGVISHISMGFAILILRDLFSKVSLLWIVGARLLVGEIMLISLCLATRRWDDLKAAFQVKQGRWHLVLATFFGSYIAVYLWAAGFKYTLAGRAAIYNQMSTIFIILLAWLVLKEKLTRHRIIAVALGISGAVLVGS